MILSPAGRVFIQTREGGFKAVPYADSGGVITWGYGHACGPHEVPPTIITLADAEILFNHDTGIAVDDCNTMLGYPDVPQNVFDALVSFVFNVGYGNLRKLPHSTLNAIMARDWPTVARKMLTWCHVNGKYVQGLYNRRVLEVGLLLYK